jgi:hypothetical protein
MRSIVNRPAQLYNETGDSGEFAIQTDGGVIVKYRRRLWCAVLLLFGLARELPARTWSDVTGTHKLTAEFVDADDEHVRLKKPDGQIIAVPLAKLSPADREHVRQLKAQSADGEKAAAKLDRPASKTGRFSTSFAEHHPLSASSAIMARMMSPSDLRATAAKIQQKLGGRLPEHLYDIKAETFQVYVPEDYDASVPYGLFVYINAGNDGGPGGDWLPLFKKHRLIFVGADKSGNDEDPVLRRGALALDAVFNVGRQYQVDPARIYVCGISGGGRNASWMALAFPDVFTGGQYHIGANCYKSITSKLGTLPATIHVPSPQLFNAARQNGRYVFITGDKDFNRLEMTAIHGIMQGDGFRHLTFLQVPGLDHHSPPPEWIEKGLTALDAPLAQAAKSDFDRGWQMFERQQWGKALGLLRNAAAHGSDQPFAAEAREKLQAVTAKYQADLAAIEESIEKGELTAANKQIADFRRRWGDAGQNDVKRLGQLVQAARKRAK